MESNKIENKQTLAQWGEQYRQTTDVLRCRLASLRRQKKLASGMVSTELEHRISIMEAEIAQMRQIARILTHYDRPRLSHKWRPVGSASLSAFFTASQAEKLLHSLLI